MFLILPIFVIYKLCRNFHRLEDKDFEEKYGSLYEGLKTKNRSAIFFSVNFIMRRILFAVLATGVNDFVWLQIATQYFFLVATIMYLCSYNPIESKR